MLAIKRKIFEVFTFTAGSGECRRDAGATGMTGHDPPGENQPMRAVGRRGRATRPGGVP